MSEWLDIETAPKDGSPIMAFVPANNEVRGLSGVVHAYYSEGEWRVANDWHGYYSGIKPTCWQLAPALPGMAIAWPSA